MRRSARLAARGWLDGLTSDYVPSSMLQGAFLMAERERRGLPEAIAMVTSAPARMARLDDRGSIETGLRADFIRVRSIGGIPRVISVWREGTRVSLKAARSADRHRDDSARGRSAGCRWFGAFGEDVRAFLRHDGAHLIQNPERFPASLSNEQIV